MRHRPAHPSRRVMLGEAVGREDVGKNVGSRLPVGGVVTVVGTRELLAGRVGPLAVEGVLERRLVWLVMRRERPVGQAGRRVQPARAVRLHDEWLVSPDGVLGLCVVGRLVVRALGSLEVGDIKAGPLPLLFVPPDVFLALAPRLPLGVCGGPIVDDATVHRPRPRPLRGDPVLLSPGLAPCGLVDLVFIDAAVDPTATGGRAIRLKSRVPGHGIIVLVPAVDLAQHSLGVGLVVRALGRVVPGQVEYSTVLRVVRVRELLSDLASEVVHKPQLRAAVALRLDRLLAPL